MLVFGKKELARAPGEKLHGAEKRINNKPKPNTCTSIMALMGGIETDATLVGVEHSYSCNMLAHSPKEFSL